MKCTSGKHEWTDQIHADRCCNGWHQELRTPQPNPDDEPTGQIQVHGIGTFVWVKETPCPCP